MAPAYKFMWLPFSQPVDAHAPLLSQDSDPIASDVDSGSSNSSSDTSSIAEVAQSESKNHDKPIEVIQADEAVFAKHGNVTHAMVTCHDDNGSRPFHLDNYWKAACGARMLHSETEFLDEWQPSMAFCQHAGCKKVWASINLA